MRWVIGLAGLLLAAAASASTIDTGREVPQRIVSLCRSEASAHAIVEAAIRGGVDEMNRLYRASSECGPRYIAFRVDKVVSVNEIAKSDQLIKLLLIQSLLHQERWWAVITTTNGRGN